MNVYIDFTSFLRTNLVTGIQRSVWEFVARMRRDKCVCIYPMYSRGDDCLHVLDMGILPFMRQPGKAPLIEKAVRSITVEEFAAGDVLFDLDIVDPTSFARPRYLPMLKARGVIIVSYVYDVIAITHPQYQTQFLLSIFPQWLVSHLLYDDCLITSAEFTVRQIESICKQIGVNMPPHKVVPLGADISQKLDTPDISSKTACAEVMRTISGKQYILTVGTLEPRKNHQYLLDVAHLPQWSELDIEMVFVGRQGWNVDSLMENIACHPEHNKSVFYFDYVNDSTLHYLYQNAHFVVYPTKIEGFGLPTVEAIHHGTPVLCSDIPIMHEVAGDFADYFSLDNPLSLWEKLRFYLDNPREYAALKAKLTHFIPPSWGDGAKKILSILKALEKKEQDSRKG